MHINSGDDKPKQSLEERLAELMNSQEDENNDKESVKVSFIIMLLKHYF